MPKVDFKKGFKATKLNCDVIIDYDITFSIHWYLLTCLIEYAGTIILLNLRPD